MAGKFHVFLVGLGVLLMTSAGYIAVQWVLGRDDYAAATTASQPRPTPGRTGSASPSPTPPAVTATPSPTPSRTPVATTTQPRPTTSTSTSTQPPDPQPAPTTPSTPPAPPPWQLVWSDSFDDLGNWSAANDVVGGSGQACLTNRPANVAASGGVLTLRAQAEPDFPCAGQTTAFTTASLTLNRSFTYCAVEVVASGPAGNTTGLSAAMSLGGFDVVRGPGNGMNVYRIEWEAGTIRSYVNNTLVSETPTSAADSRTLTISLAVGAVDANTALPAEFKLDSVKVYQR